MTSVPPAVCASTLVIALVALAGGIAAEAARWRPSDQSSPAAPAQTLPAPPAAVPPDGDAGTGRKLFESYGCFQCHGYEGQGGAAGPRLAPRPLAFAAFVRIVRRPPNQMPAYTERLLPETDLAHIHAYLRSRPEPPSVDSIPLLRQ